MFYHTLLGRSCSVIHFEYMENKMFETLNMKMNEKQGMWIFWELTSTYIKNAGAE